MTIEWAKQAWDEVAGTTITKCFKKTGLYPDSEAVDDDPFEGEDNQQLGDLLAGLDVAEQYIAEEDDLEVCQPPIDSSDPNWRQTVRDYALNQYNANKEDTDAMEDEDVEENFEINNEDPPRNLVTGRRNRTCGTIKDFRRSIMNIKNCRWQCH